MNTNPSTHLLNVSLVFFILAITVKTFIPFYSISTFNFADVISGFMMTFLVCGQRLPLGKKTKIIAPGIYLPVATLSINIK